jgi:hypothetical protein
VKPPSKLPLPQANPNNSLPTFMNTHSTNKVNVRRNRMENTRTIGFNLSPPIPV